MLYCCINPTCAMWEDSAAAAQRGMQTILMTKLSIVVLSLVGGVLFIVDDC